MIRPDDATRGDRAPDATRGDRAPSGASARPDADGQPDDDFRRVRDLARRLARTTALNSERAGDEAQARWWAHAHGLCREILSELPAPPGQEPDDVVAYEDVAALVAPHTPLTSIDAVLSEPDDRLGGRSLLDVARDHGLDVARRAAKQLFARGGAGNTEADAATAWQWLDELYADSEGTTDV